MLNTQSFRLLMLWLLKLGVYSCHYPFFSSRIYTAKKPFLAHISLCDVTLLCSLRVSDCLRRFVFVEKNIAVLVFNFDITQVISMSHFTATNSYTLGGSCRTWITSGCTLLRHWEQRCEVSRKCCISFLFTDFYYVCCSNAYCVNM